MGNILFRVSLAHEYLVGNQDFQNLFIDFDSIVESVIQEEYPVVFWGPLSYRAAVSS